MKKVIIIIFVFFLSIGYCFSSEVDYTTNVEKLVTDRISNNSTDVNQDKLDISIGEGISISTGFGNSSSDGSEWVGLTRKILSILSLVISMFALIAIVGILGSMVFVSDQNKIKELRSLLIKTVVGFIFYVFVASTVYTWILQIGEKHTGNSIVNGVDINAIDNNEFHPRLLRE